MASKITILQATSLGSLEEKINNFLEQWGTDPRIEVDLIGGITYAGDVDGIGQYMAPMRLSAPHKRTFEDSNKEDTE